MGLLNVLASEDPRTPVIPEDIAAGLPALVQDAEIACAPLSDQDLMLECTAVAAAIGLGASQKEKTEWIASAIVQLSRFPAGLVREALQDAPLNVSHLNNVIRFVADYCEDYPARMALRRDRLIQLQLLAKEQHPHV